MSTIMTNKTAPKTPMGKKMVKKAAKPAKAEPVEQVAQTVEPEAVKKAVKRAPKKPVENAEVAVAQEVKKPKKPSSRSKKEELVVENKPAPKRASATKKEQEPPQEESEEEKKPKKINNKPTLSDVCGLNISVAKVKNIISNLCINSEPFWALKDLKERRVMEEDKHDAEGKVVGRGVDESGKRHKRPFTFTLDGLSQQTLDFLERAHQYTLESAREAHAKQKVKDMTEEDRKRYSDARKAAVAEHNSELKHAHLFQLHEFDSVSFNNRWDKNFYKGMEVTDWKSLKDMELYAYCANLINKMKVRFNSESKIFITAFVEHIVTQMVVNGTVNCVKDGKKIIKLEHALARAANSADEKFSLYPLITNLNSFHQHLSSAHVDVVVSNEEAEEHVEQTDDGEHDESEEVHGEQVDRKYQFKHYVSEICRTVKMELAKEDQPNDFVNSAYYSTSVSKVFKDFCSNVIVDLIRVIGELLKIEVSSRNVKTVNYTIIQTLLQLTHTAFGVEDHLNKTVNFIQERYCIYQKYIEERKEKRGSKADEDDEDEL